MNAVGNRAEIPLQREINLVCEDNHAGRGAEEDLGLKAGENSDQRQDERRQNHGAHQRDDDPKERRTSRGARHAGRLFQRCIHTAECGQHQDRQDAGEPKGADEDHSGQEKMLSGPVLPLKNGKTLRS